MWGQAPRTALEDLEEILSHGGVEALVQAARSSCGCPIPLNVQGQDAWALGSPA